VKEKTSRRDATARRTTSPPREGAANPRRGSDFNKDKVRADADLARRCLAGEVAAWEAFYAQCHDPLMVSIRIMLGRQASDASLVEEIAARVWYAMVANDGELLARYDPGRGARLITFMRTLAKDEISRHLRAEFRRRERLLVALRERPQQRAELAHTASSLAEFLGTLTPNERSFCSDYLLARAPEGVAAKHSMANVWQLSRRVYQKLLRFLDHQG
jgi:hypothetical protein